mmetsp:Transcript_26099/g.39494  ORF Transcript_26099/g.39494 Transcript_26099/m.39494 type:complete len:192 (+) Transcript_26099:159-734(+)
MDHSLTSTIPTELLNCKSNLCEFDVICARGRITKEHIGNIRYRKMVLQYLPIYSALSTKSEKSMVVSRIINSVRERGDFVKYCGKTGNFEKVSERIAREKVGQRLRDMLHTQYKSSTQAKKMRRHAQKTSEDEQIRQVVRNNQQVKSIMSRAVSEMHDFNSDQDFDNIFTLANASILEEFKRSRSIDAVMH